MKQIDLISRGDWEEDDGLLRELACSPYVTEARLITMNTSAEPSVYAFIVNGKEEIIEELTEHPTVRAIDAISIYEGTYALLIECDHVNLFKQVRQAIVNNSVAVNLPVIYRDGEVYWSIIGFDSAMDEVVRALPGNNEITRIGEFITSPENVLGSLSQRQRTVLQTALELGYYDSPRGATHSDIAEVLECAPSTVTVHLQKAEATVFRELFKSPEGVMNNSYLHTD